MQQHIVQAKDDENSEQDQSEKEVENISYYFPGIDGCRNVDQFKIIKRIQEGTYGVVFSAKDIQTGEIVALKKLKMERETEGFPITSLREVNTLLKAQHPNIVNVKEIVIGNNLNKIYIVMEFMEHDLKSLMETMKRPFEINEVKTLMLQLLRACAHLHDNWILHRDLKTSNLLLNHQGILKVADFGLAREYGSPLKQYTKVVVTLWYRAPELLLLSEKYSTAIDIWSVGCIFGELLTMKPLFPGQSEAQQIELIFKTLGTPNERIWENYEKKGLARKIKLPDYKFNRLSEKISDDKIKVLGDTASTNLFKLWYGLLTYNPDKRVTAEAALNSKFFTDEPQPIQPSLFPTWPAKSELGLKTA